MTFEDMSRVSTSAIQLIIEKMEEKGYSGDRQFRYRHMLYEDKETHIKKTKINFVILALKSAIKFEQGPPKPWNIEFDKYDNETSILTLLTYKDKNILLMADGGIEAFNSIKEYLPDKINILKIGHHGAKNVINQNILNKTKPDFALISSYFSHFSR